MTYLNNTTKYLLIIISLFLFHCSSSPTNNSNDDTVVIIEEEEDETFSTINLNIRIHLMKDIVMVHPTGTSMDSWVTPDQVRDIIIPELNAIWDQANIIWVIESIIEEEVVKGDNYQASLNYVVNAVRDSDGKADAARLPHLFSLMQPENMSKPEELGENLFHIYLFPFIGNTSQGNAMSGFNFHTVLGTWTNKHNNGGIPEKTLLVESQSAFDRGSLSRTIAHEVGHVLNLNHNECSYGCLMGGINSDGYTLTDDQKIKSRIEAFYRSI